MGNECLIQYYYCGVLNRIDRKFMLITSTILQGKICKFFQRIRYVTDGTGRNLINVKHHINMLTTLLNASNSNS